MQGTVERAETSIICGMYVKRKGNIKDTSQVWKLNIAKSIFVSDTQISRFL